MRIWISISDPWELGESLRWQPFRGKLLQTVSDERGGRALVKLDGAVNYLGSKWRYVVASPRRQGEEIGEVHNGKKVACSLMGISERQAQCGSPLDTSNWRGGLGFVGDVGPAE